MSDTKEWSEEFDEKWIGDELHGTDLYSTGSLLKRFISTLLASKEKEAAENERKLLNKALAEEYGAWQQTSFDAGYAKATSLFEEKLDELAEYYPVIGPDGYQSKVYIATQVRSIIAQLCNTKKGERI